MFNIENFLSDWSRSEIISFLGLAATALMFVGGVIDRLLLAVYEYWKSVKCYGKLNEVRAYNATRNSLGQEVSLQIFNTLTKQTKNHHIDEYTDDTVSVVLAIDLRFFNTKKKNVGLQEIRLVLVRRKFRFWKTGVGNFRVSDATTKKVDQHVSSCEEVGTLTLLPREWNEIKCVSERIPIAAYLESEEVWVKACDENQRQWKHMLQPTPEIRKLNR